MVVLTFKEINQIDFPVFKLESQNIDKQDGIVFIDGFVLDDRNMSGKKLGQRRMQTPLRNLYELRASINGVVGLAKQVGNNAYIDSSGRIFIYEKTLFCKLQYHRITKVSLKDTASSVHLKGIQQAFQVPRPPHPDMNWAGVLYFHGLPWKLYEFSENHKPTARKKI